MRVCFALLLVLLAAPLASADDSELLNQEERRWLDSLDRPLIVATEFYYHPYNFVDEQGELSGVVGDYMRLLQERLGFEYEVRVYDTFAELLVAAAEREVDIVPLLVAAPERKSYLNFTQPAYATRDRIFTRKEMQATLTVQDLGRMRVGMVEGYALHAEFAENQPEIEMVYVATELDGLRDLSMGRLDAFISEIGTSSYYIQQEGITNLRVAGEVDGSDAQTFGSRSDWPLLNSILKKGLASITELERTEIQQRWINFDADDSRGLKRLWKQAVTAVGLIALLVFVILIWTFSLRRQIAKNTLEMEQEHAERLALEATKLRLAVAVEQSAEFVLVIDTAARIEYANRSFLEACGVPNLEGRPITTLTASGTDNIVTAALREIGKVGVWQGHLIFARDRDEPLKVFMTISPILNEGSELDGYVATGRDVTKQEQLEARLRRGEKLSALGTLAGGIAHDFNNLLTPISGYNELIRDQNLPQLQPYLDGIEEASVRARDLVRRIMTFGREGSGEMVPIDLRAEVEDSISFLRSLLPTTIKLEQQLEKCGPILGDTTQIQQILLNLCSNASDAMIRDGGTLTIKLAQRSVDERDELDIVPGEFAVLTVSDTGVGMEDDTRAKIFDPYFSDKQLASGTGLGLSIVHGIVELYGGTIWVNSAPDKGTTFRIFLPIAATPASHQKETPEVETPHGDGATILLVDDDVSVLNTVKNMLRGLGYQVSAWSDPQEALTTFTANPHAFDAVLTDFTMPGMTGIQFSSSVSTVRADIPVSIMTGNTNALQDDQALCISKPMKMSELADHMIKLLSQPNRVDQEAHTQPASET